MFVQKEFVDSEDANASNKKNNEYNLVYEKWIPTSNCGLVSIIDVFTNKKIGSIGSNSVHKISVLKFLIAVAQASFTPKDYFEWKGCGVDGLSEKVVKYLNENQDSFYLYGERPFLQKTGSSVLKKSSFSFFISEVASGNNAIVNSKQLDKKKYEDSDIALLLLQQLNFGFGGKKTDNSLSFQEGYVKSKGSKAGPSLGMNGYLHSFLMSDNSLLETVWLNLFTQEDVVKMGVFGSGVGMPVWNFNDLTEDNDASRSYKDSLLGRLVPVSFFILVSDDKKHFHATEGVKYLMHDAGVVDTSVYLGNSGKKFRSIYVDTAKKPWRMLTSILSFLDATEKSEFTCFQIDYCLNRATKVVDSFRLWSGGVSCSFNAGENYIGASDDYVESIVSINSEELGSDWFNLLKDEFSYMEFVAEEVSKRIYFYQKELGSDSSKEFKNKFYKIYWHQCEPIFFNILNNLEDNEKINQYRSFIAKMAINVFNDVCPIGSARKIEAWSKSKPDLSKLKKEKVV